MTKKMRMSLSIDLDNKWSYLKTHGDKAWQGFPSYLDLVVPRILQFLAERKLRITFFVVGQDADLEKNREALGSISSAGHEIANHSFHHEPWLHLYSREQLEEELSRAEDAIESVTNIRVRGFRGPGFSLSENTLSVLKERAYQYDATVFPNLLNPLARAYFFSKSKLTDEEKIQRKALFGSFSDAFRPVKPYRWNLPEGDLLELPVTTMPLLKIPIHFSYLIYLAGFSPILARNYLRTAIAACRLTGTEPSLLMHPLDFLGAEDDSDLCFFPAMNMPTELKLSHMNGFLRMLVRHFDPLTMSEHVAIFEKHAELPNYQPRFSF